MYAISLLMEYAAFVKLRLYHKECKPLLSVCVVRHFRSTKPHLTPFIKNIYYIHTVQRPWRIPVPDWAVVLIVIPPTIGVLFVLATSNWYIWAFTVGSLLFGYILLEVNKVSKHLGWFEYEASKPNRRNQYDPPVTGDDATEQTESTSSKTSCASESSSVCASNDLQLYEETGLTQNESEWNYRNERFVGRYEGELT